MEVRRLELQTDDTAKIDRETRGAIACRPPVRTFNIEFLKKKNG